MINESEMYNREKTTSSINGVGEIERVTLDYT